MQAVGGSDGPRFRFGVGDREHVAVDEEAAADPLAVGAAETASDVLQQNEGDEGVQIQRCPDPLESECDAKECAAKRE